MSEEAGPRYRGLDRYECRKRIVRDLMQAVTCSRRRTTPTQWGIATAATL